VVQPNGTSWYKLEYLEKVEQGEAGLQIYVEQVEQEQGGLQIDVGLFSWTSPRVPKWVYKAVERLLRVDLNPPNK